MSKKLLDILIDDEKKINKKLYSSGPYWDYKNRKTLYEIKKKGIDVIMKEGGENKIDVYHKKSLKIKEGIKYISKVTSLNINIFITKTLSKKNLTNNFKYKI